jgi:hypothetical protein
VDNFHLVEGLGDVLESHSCHEGYLLSLLLLKNLFLENSETSLWLLHVKREGEDFAWPHLLHKLLIDPLDQWKWV